MQAISSAHEDVQSVSPVPASAKKPGRVHAEAKDVGLDSCESKQAHMLEGSWDRQGDRQSQPQSRQGIRTHRCMKLLSRLFSSNSGATNMSLFFDWARV